MYAALDGIASYVLGAEYFDPGCYDKCYRYQTALLKSREQQQKQEPAKKRQRISGAHLGTPFTLVRSCIPTDQFEADRIMGDETAKDDNTTVYTWYNTDVTKADLYRLNDGEWLCDELITVYTLMLQAATEDVHVFFSHFWYRVRNNKDKYTYAAVKNWTKNVDLFKCRLALLPIHLPGHWTLAAVRFDERTVHYYDSLYSPGDEYMKTVWMFLQDHYKNSGRGKMSQEEKNKWRFINHPECPQQQNGYDCGVFVCCFSLCLTFGLPLDTFQQDDIRFFRRHMALSIQKGMLDNFLTYPAERSVARVCGTCLTHPWLG